MISESAQAETAWTRNHSGPSDKDASEAGHRPGQGRGRGFGRGMGRGPGMLGGMRLDMTTLHAMFDDRDRTDDGEDA